MGTDYSKLSPAYAKRILRGLARGLTKEQAQGHKPKPKNILPFNKLAKSTQAKVTQKAKRIEGVDKRLSVFDKYTVVKNPTLDKNTAGHNKTVLRKFTEFMKDSNYTTENRQRVANAYKKYMKSKDMTGYLDMMQEYRDVYYETHDVEYAGRNWY